MKRTSVTRKMALILAAIVLMTASGCGRRENADKEDNNITIYKSKKMQMVLTQKRYRSMRLRLKISWLR